MQGCSISGGVRVRGGPVPALEGWYVYADYCSGMVWALEVTGEGADIAAGRTVELPSVEAPTAVVEGPTGEVYILSAAGPVYRLDPALGLSHPRVWSSPDRDRSSQRACIDLSWQWNE